MNQRLKNGLTIIAIPLILVIYFIDRVITIAFPLADVHPIQKWIFDTKAMTNSLIRFVVVGVCVGLYLIISSLF